MDLSSLFGALHPSSAVGSSATRGAIHLKLTEEVFQKLMAIAASNDHSGLQIDLGVNPAFLIRGDSFPVSLDDAPPNQEVAVRVDGTRPGWQPIASLKQHARVKPGLAALQKAGEGLRGNYQMTEQERAERRTVQLATPGSALPSRTASPAGGAAADSRNNSKTRQPSRLSAVPPKQPTSSFKLGKGSLATTNMIKSASAAPDSSALERSASLNRTTAASAAPALPAQNQQPAQAASPVRQASSTSSEESGSIGGSHTSSSARTSMSSAGSPPGLTATLPVNGVTPAVKANGGVMKGKDTIKKEARSANKSTKPGSAQSPPAKTTPLAKAGSPPAPARSSKSSVTASTSNNKRSSISTAQSDRDLDSDALGKKRRKLLNNVAPAADKNGRRSESPARAETPISSPRLSSSSRLAASTRQVKKVDTRKKRTSRPELRFTSSDEDEDAEGEEDVEMMDLHPVKDTKRTRHSSGDVTASDRGRNPLRVGQLSAPSASPRAAAASPLRLPDIPISILRIDSRKGYDDAVNQFNEGFGPYAKLHAQLEAERERLAAGEAGEIDIYETERLVGRLEKSRAHLEGLKASMLDWVKREKAKALA